MTDAVAARDPGLAVRLNAFAQRPLTPREVAEQLSLPIGQEERAEVLSLVSWFRRRYPTPADRLAYVRRAYSRWTGSRAGRAVAQ